MERGDQRELLALFLLAGVRGAEPAEVGVLAGQARRRRLSAGVRIGAGVEHDDLDRRRRAEHARQRAESDVVGRAVAAHADDGRQQAQLLGREVGPGERPEVAVVRLGVVFVGEVELGDPERPDVAARLRAQALEDALGDRGRVLEQAVHPRVVVRIEREGRGIDAAAAGRVGDHGAGGPMPSRTAFEQIEALLQSRDRSARCARAASDRARCSAPTAAWRSAARSASPPRAYAPCAACRGSRDWRR